MNLSKKNLIFLKLFFSQEKSNSPSSSSQQPQSKSRREELMKQLKAVEEAIAKKRSKIEK